MEAEAADQVMVSESAVSAVRSTVTAAGVSSPAEPNTPMAGAPVALPTDGAAAEPTFCSPMAKRLPEEPLARVVIQISVPHNAAVTVAVVIVPLSQRRVPATPPQRRRKRMVGVAVVLWITDPERSR